VVRNASIYISFPSHIFMKCLIKHKDAFIFNVSETCSWGNILIVTSIILIQKTWISFFHLELVFQIWNFPQNRIIIWTHLSVSMVADLWIVRDMWVAFMLGQFLLFCNEFVRKHFLSCLLDLKFLLQGHIIPNNVIWLCSMEMPQSYLFITV
jgi:hypothetical protein